MTAIGVRGRSPRRGRADRWSDTLRGAAVAVVLIGVVGSVLLAQGWQSTVTRQRDERLDRTAASRTVTISSALANYENALQAARSLWLASGSVSRKEFSIFARSLDLGDRYPGLQGIGWRTVVTDDQADEFVARTRTTGAPGFTIMPPGRRPVYYVTPSATRGSPPATPLESTPVPSPASWPPWSRPAHRQDHREQPDHAPRRHGPAGGRAAGRLRAVRARLRR